MALFDNINSRYTKSMEHGGSYERDAAIGGYDRKELRGLSKQAKRGTLTQRERARYKYLKDERGGRRKRGLLSGLGGAGAVLAGLAASGKLGGLGGGGEGGSALMDAIKGRLSEGKVNLQDKLGLVNDKRLAKKLGVDPREYVDDSPASAVTEDVSSDMQLPPELRDTPRADIVANSMDEARRRQIIATNERNDQYVTDRDANLADKLNRIEAEENAVSAANEGGDPLRQPISNTGDRVVDEAAIERNRVVDEAAIERERQANMQEMPGGPVARGGMSPVIPSPDGSQPLADEAISDIIRQMRSDADEEEAAMSSNSPTNINEVTGMNSRSVDLGSDFPAKLPTEAEVALRGVPINFNTNRRPVESSNNQSPAVDPNDALTGIFQRTGQRPVRANSVDPMGIIQGDSRDENVSEAQREEDAVNFLITLNKRRVDKGLPKVNKITMDAIKETGRSTSELMTPRQIGQIPTNRPEKNLPQLEALQQLKSILGNRYN